MQGSFQKSLFWQKRLTRLLFDRVLELAREIESYVSQLGYRSAVVILHHCEGIYTKIQTDYYGHWPFDSR